MGFSNTYHTRTFQVKRAEIVVTINVLDNKSGHFEQEFHFVALKKVKMGSHCGTMHRAALAVLIVKMRQFQQVAIRCSGRADEMSEHGTIITLPTRLMQHVASQFLHIARIGITDINNECSARTHVSMY